MLSQIVQNLFNNVSKYLKEEPHSTNPNYDVVLHIGEGSNYKKFYAHSVTLKTSCTYFESALSGRWLKMEDNYYILNKPNISSEVFEIILKFIYTETLPSDKSVPPPLLFELLIAADELCLGRLIDHTQKQLNDSLDCTNFFIDNLIVIYNLTTQFPHFQILQRHFLMLVEKHPTEIFQSHNFLELPEEILLSCLKNDYLHLYEIEIWEKVLDWGINQIPRKLNRCNVEEWEAEDFIELEMKLKNCMPLIRFYHIKSGILYNEVIPFQPIIPDPIFNKILKFHLTNEILSLPIEISNVRCPELYDNKATLSNTLKLLDSIDKYFGYFWSRIYARKLHGSIEFLPRYLEGVTKLTYLPGYKSDNYVKFDDLVQKPILKQAFLSSMIVDFAWLSSKLPNNRQIVLAKDWRIEDNETQGLNGVPNTKYLIVHAPKSESGFGCFHAKLMLLFFDNWMRVVISSGNLVPQDWELCENVVFIQDFLARDKSKEYNGLQGFARDINDFLVAMGLKTHIVNLLPEYDYSKSKATLVPSIPGIHKGMENIKRFGHGRISKAVKEFCGSREDVQLEFQSSSIGSLNKQYLVEFYLSARGLDPVSAQSRPRPKKGEADHLPPIIVVYPSHEAKFAIASTICLSEKAYIKNTFPKEILRNCISKRDGMLMHSKFALAQFREKPNEMPLNVESQENAGGWYYCGSHNFSESAWGKITTSRESKELQIRIYNWELGVFFPIYRKEQEYLPNQDFDKKDWFNEHSVPVPYIRPPPRYVRNETPKDIFFEVLQLLAESYGNH
ncbi:12540_t:CDS:10 [Funneliformis geosporum]|nr:12540_t:CDS:10 [Funneliformis geosporum]